MGIFQAVFGQPRLTQLFRISTFSTFSREASAFKEHRQASMHGRADHDSRGAPPYACEERHKLRSRVELLPCRPACHCGLTGNLTPPSQAEFVRAGAPALQSAKPSQCYRVRVLARFAHAVSKGKRGQPEHAINGLFVRVRVCRPRERVPDRVGSAEGGRITWIPVR